jgi:hypothetical protein
MVAQAEDVMPGASLVREKLNKAFELIAFSRAKHGHFSWLSCLSLSNNHIYKPEVHKVYIIEIKNPYLCSGLEAAIISALKPTLNTDFNPDAVVFNSNDPKQELGTEPKIKSDNTMIENTKRSPLPFLWKLPRFCLSLKLSNNIKQI